MYRFAFAFALLVAAPAAVAQTWTLQSAPTASDLSAVVAIDELTAFATGDNSTLLATSDGGQTWTAQTVAGGFDLESLAFNANGVGLVASDDGVVFRTTDGTTFTAVGTGADDLRGVAWGNNEVAFAAGRDASGARSDDGGQTWTAFSTGATQRTEDVEAVGADLFWAVGRAGEIRFSDDGGTTWGAQQSGTTNDLNAVQMLSAQIGYIAGSGDTVLKTTDGGQTWTNVSTDGAGGGALAFLDENTGWVVDEIGEVWFTNNGGVTWELQPTPTSAELNGVTFVDAQHGWAVGAGGTIIAFGTPTTDVDDEASPSRLRLDVAPNPFAERTTLHYSLPEPGGVRVVVYDVLGREAVVLLDEMHTAGDYDVPFVAADLPSGIYFVRVAAGTASETLRITLTR